MIVVISLVEAFVRGCVCPLRGLTIAHLSDVSETIDGGKTKSTC